MESDPEFLTEEEAARLWQRAARLQAEAARRAEKAESKGAESATADVAPPEGYALTHVWSAALEVGITDEFVDAALADLRAERALPQDKRGWRLARWFLKDPPETQTARRVIEASAADVLSATEAVFPAEPYRLTMTDRQGDPLKGGFLVFDVQGLNSPFEPVCMITDHPSALIVRGDRWADVDALRTAAVAEPQALTVGNVGLRGIWHQHAAAMEGALGIEVRHVPYEGGSGPQLAAIIGGEVDAIVSSLPAAMSYVRDGALRVLAIMAEERNGLIPNVPTFRELGFDLVYGGLRMVVAPSGTPEVVLGTLETACAAAAEDPDFSTWASAAAIGASWRDRTGSIAYLEQLATKVERLMAEMEAR